MKFKLFFFIFRSVRIFLLLLFKVKLNLQIAEGSSAVVQREPEAVGIFPSEGIVVSERSRHLNAASSGLTCAEPELDVGLSANNQQNVGILFFQNFSRAFKNSYCIKSAIHFQNPNNFCLFQRFLHLYCFHQTVNLLHIISE